MTVLRAIQQCFSQIRILITKGFVHRRTASNGMEGGAGSFIATIWKDICINGMKRMDRIL